MNAPDSLYGDARMVEVGAGAERVRLCISQSMPLAPHATRRALLIHGNPSHMDHWVHTVPMLRSHAAVLAYDQAGFGRSDDFADRRPTLERSVALAAAVLDSVGWRDVDVVGHSHGCLVAIAMAALMPERIRSLILLASGGFPTHGSYRLLELPGVDYAVFGLGRLWFGNPSLAPLARRAVRIGAASSFAPDPVPESLVQEELEDLAKKPERLLAMARLSHHDPCERTAQYARKLHAPALFIHGIHDALVRIDYVRRLFAIVRETSPDAELVEIDGGHMAHWTKPSLVNPLIEAWFARTERVSP
jgi:pimeloyl-ACP methyl ester carboxylesterase